MITARLWEFLMRPPGSHPLFRRVVQSRRPSAGQQVVWRLISPLAPFAYVGGMLVLCCSVTSSGFGLALVGLIAGLVLFNATFFGSGWAMRIAGELSRERRSGDWDLLCVLPGGEGAATWAIAGGALHRGNALRSHYGRHMALLRGLLVMAGVFVAGFALYPQSAIGADYLLIAGYLVFAVALSYVDFVQSIVLAGLVGVLAGTRTQDGLDAKIWAVSAFLALQLLVYAVSLMAALGALPWLVQRVFAPGLPGEIALFALRLLVFAGCRELLIALVWHWTAGQRYVPGRQVARLTGTDV